MGSSCATAKAYGALLEIGGAIAKFHVVFFKYSLKTRAGKASIIDWMAMIN
jgi:hypothetical protein